MRPALFRLPRAARAALAVTGIAAGLTAPLTASSFSTASPARVVVPPIAAAPFVPHTGLVDVARSEVRTSLLPVQPHPAPPVAPPAPSAPPVVHAAAAAAPRVATPAVSSELARAEAWAASAPVTRLRYCESSGNYSASNGTHFGAYQMDLNFWYGYGGGAFASSPLGASRTAQDLVAFRGWEARGFEPWSCAYAAYR